MDNLDKLQEAVEKQEQAIKLLILKMLHLNGIIAFDASECMLDEDVEQAISPAPQGNYN